MRTAPAAPYLLPSTDTISDLPWTLQDGRPVPDRLEHWDPFTDTEFFRTIEVDADKVREECALGTDATLAVLASWHSERTRLSHGTVVELGSLSGLVRAGVSLKVPASEAGGRLDLRTRLVLRHPGAEASPIAPRREGAVLLAQETRISLEGVASRFPVAVVDFDAVPQLPKEAAWYLDWNAEELDAPVLGGMRLLLNQRHDLLLDALRSGSTDPRKLVVRSFVMHDVARSLVQGALSNERFLEDAESYDEGTVGRMLSELLALCWPTTALGTLRVRTYEDPARIEAELQAHFGVLG